MERNICASSAHVAIACGGTGGHLFPGVAVAGALKQRGCRVTLLISPKEIDQLAVKFAGDFEVATLPAIGLVKGKRLAFARGLFKSWQKSRLLFAGINQPDAVLAMGGFTSAPPVWVGKQRGAATFLHESNTIPGKANRWLSRVVGQAFVGFAETGRHLHTRQIKVTGTPVRSQFRPMAATACREALGLDADRPVLVVTGGSQGASGLNDLVIQSLPLLAAQMPGLQLLHLAGPNDEQKIKSAAEAAKITAQVFPFHSEMHLVLGAATVVISRAGASSLAELAAIGAPAILVPFPAATDNHQFYNAQALVQTGAAWFCQQKNTTPAELAEKVISLATSAGQRQQMIAALTQWHFPNAAVDIAENILQAVTLKNSARKTAALTLPESLKHQQSAII